MNLDYLQDRSLRPRLKSPILLRPVSSGRALSNLFLLLIIFLIGLLIHKKRFIRIVYQFIVDIFEKNDSRQNLKLSLLK